MDKNSSQGAVCIYCDKDAVYGTYPPVCADHVNNTQDKKASGDNEPSSLKELNSM